MINFLIALVLAWSPMHGHGHHRHHHQPGRPGPGIVSCAPAPGTCTVRQLPGPRF